MNEKYHEMTLEKTHISGLEEWYCPACGRRFVMQWSPGHRMIILEAGDKDTRHNVSRRNSRIGPRQGAQPEATELSDEFRLVPWLKWMENVDFDRLWGPDA